MEVDGVAADSNIVVPLKVKKEEGENKEADEEEENIEDADYNSVPIESFGMALLKGMGFTEENKGPSFE